VSKSNLPSFRPLLQKALAKRAALGETCTAFRALNGLVDGLEGVAIDLYGSHVQLQFFDRTWFWCEDELVRSIIDVYKPQFLVVKERLDPSGKSLEKPQMRVVYGADVSSSTIVREGVCSFSVDLLDTVNPGLFLDMREQRLALAPLCAGGELLNLFCYTGSFSVHARKAGATRAVNVDVSGKILDRVRANYELNQIEPLKGEFFKGDATEYLEYAVRKGLLFQTVVLDPPSFSRSERGVFQVKAHLQSLARIGALVTAPGGHFFVSTNHSEYNPTMLVQESVEWIAAAGRKAEVVRSGSQGQDFPGAGRTRESSLSTVLLRMLP